MFEDREKSRWLGIYEDRVMKRAKKRPRWQHLPAGHMYYGMGLSPLAAARRFLHETVWGARRKRHAKHRKTR
jgi:hypothetical protein